MFTFFISASCLDFGVPSTQRNLENLLSFGGTWGKTPMYYLGILNDSLFFDGFERLQWSWAVKNLHVTHHY